MHNIDNQKYFNPSKILFYISYTTIILQNMLGQVTSIENILSVLSKIAMLFLIITCFFNIIKLKRKSAIILLASTSIIGLAALITGDNILLLTFLTIVACKNINLEKFAKYDIFLKLFLLLLVVSLYYAGLTTVNLHFRNGEIRHSMGFSNPNRFSFYIMSILLEFLFLRRNKIGMKEVLITILSIFIVDYFADSRTQIFCIIGALILLLINQWKNGKIFQNKLFQIIAVNSFLILLLISNILVQFYINSPSSMQEINESLSGRLQSSAYIVKENNITLTGNDETAEVLANDENLSLDSGYIYIPYVYGILPTLLIIVAMHQYMKYMTSNRKNEIALIMLIFLISGLAEKAFIRIQLDFFLLYFSYIIYGEFSSQNSIKHLTKKASYEKSQK